MSDTPSKPIFVQSLMDATLHEGDKLKLHAAINAHPEPEVSETWPFMLDQEKLLSLVDYLVSK